MYSKNTEQRFWSKVDKTHSCWNWIGTKSYGYGIIVIDYKITQAHRFSYELAKGKIPEGLELDHLCRNRACVNPDHLEAVTHKENVLRGIAPPAKNVKKTHCPQGHEFTIENTYVRPRGDRECLMCKNKASKSWNKSNRVRQNNNLRKWRQGKKLQLAMMKL